MSADRPNENTVALARLEEQVKTLFRLFEDEKAELEDELERERAERVRLEARLRTVERVILKATIWTSAIIGLGGIVAVVLAKLETLRALFKS
jgi:hypothetical protein